MLKIIHLYFDIFLFQYSQSQIGNIIVGIVDKFSAQTAPVNKLQCQIIRSLKGSVNLVSENFNRENDTKLPIREMLLGRIHLFITILMKTLTNQKLTILQGAHVGQVYGTSKCIKSLVLEVKRSVLYKIVILQISTYCERLIFVQEIW